MRDYSQVDSAFGEALPNYVEFLSWARWYPDLFLDLMHPNLGGITLHPDQRVYLRVLVRFFSVYGCFIRGMSKTFVGVLAMHITAILYPNIDLALTAQTKDNSIKLLKDKYTEIMRFYPMMANEIVKATFTKSDAEIVFKNGSRIDALANAQSSKGQRRKRLNIEESVLLDAATFDDALEPIIEVPRYTCGKLAVVNPDEANGQINFFTTPGWRNSDEYMRNLRMTKDMLDCKGKFVFGSNWMLSCWFGRGSSKQQILQKKSNMSPTAFDQNYGGKWTGSADGALVSANRLAACRKLDTPRVESTNDADEYYVGVDVARSQKSGNNQSSIVIGRVNRDQRNNRINTVDIVNVLNISNMLNFTSQAIIIKRTSAAYNAKMTIVDGNGLGTGLIDELLKDNIDTVTGAVYPCWDTINTDNEPEHKGAPKCLYDIKAQGAQSRIISIFIDMVNSGKLNLLQKKPEQEFTDKDRIEYETNVLPFVQTELLFEEIANLKLKHNSNGSLSVEKVVRKIDKDRFSALAYLLYYIVEFTSLIKKRDYLDTAHAIRFRAPKKRTSSF